jgi:hypothetical protein
MISCNTPVGDNARQIFAELSNYGPAWGKCSENERTEFIKKVIESVSELAQPKELLLRECFCSGTFITNTALAAISLCPNSVCEMSQ